MHLETPNLENKITLRQQSVSIIIPCFNESEGIEFLHGKLLPVLEKLSLNWLVELIFVDDGSTDDTFLKLQQSFGDHAQIVRHIRNRGLSSAIKTGVSHSKGEIICTTDSDCSYDPEQLISMLKLMRDDVDIVTTSPYHPQGQVISIPAWRLFLSRGLSQIYGVVLPCKLYTYTSMCRAYRREVLETIPVKYPGFLGLVEVIAEAMLRGYKVVEYPAELRSRAFGQSKLRVARVIWSHLKYIGTLILRRFRSGQKLRSARYKYARKN